MAKWAPDSVRQALDAAGLRVASTREINHGEQLTLADDTKVNVYATGTVQVQGRDTEERRLAEAALKAGPDGKTAEPSQVPTTRVFVVYGHDTDARDQVELLLLRLNLVPVIMSNLAPDGKTIIEAIEANADVGYAVVLLTPDDVGFPKGKEDLRRDRARQNVVLELGMFLMRLGRDRVAILHKGDLELPSDINGLIYISFKDDVREAKNKLGSALQKAGFHVSIDALSAE